MTAELPDGWRLVKLGDICIEERESISRDDPLYESLPYLGLEHIESETGRILTDANTGLFSGTKSNNFRFAPDHVLYGKLRPYLNKVSLPSFAGRCTTEIIPLRPAGVNRDWLAWLLRRQDTVDYAMRGKTGSRMPRTAMRDLMQMPIPLPPLDEQRRIVNQLEAQLAAAQRAQRAVQAQLDALDALPAALLREIFPPSPAARLPRGWRWVKLGDVCENLDAARRPIKKSLRVPGPYPYYGASGIVDWVAGYLFNEPLVLIGEDGAKWESGARSAFAVSGKIWVNNHAHVLRPDRAVLLDKYMIPVLNSTDLTPYVTGLTVPKLTQKSVKSIEIPLPPLDEQRRIVQHLKSQMDAADRAQRAAQAQYDTLDVLPSALLRLAFPT